MFKSVIIGFLVLTAAFVGTASADPVYTTYWEIKGLADEDAVPVTGLILDVDFGKQFFQAYGYVDVGFGTAAHGSGYFLDGGVTIHLHMGQHFLMLLINGATLTGEAWLYGTDNKLIDTGIVNLTAIE